MDEVVEFNLFMLMAVWGHGGMEKIGMYNSIEDCERAFEKWRRTTLTRKTRLEAPDNVVRSDVYLQYEWNQRALNVYAVSVGHFSSKMLFNPANAYKHTLPTERFVP